MKQRDVRKELTTPIGSPTYPRGPCRFPNREYLDIRCRTDITIKGAWTGPARLQLFEHTLAPLADFPVREIVLASHILTDLSLARAKRCHNYLDNTR